jgi:dGTP triphosphohydrolase
MDFKDKTMTIASIRGMIEKFRIEGDELNIFKDVLLDEEFIHLKEEMKIKDDLYKKSHDAFDGERNNLLGLIDDYKSTLNEKITNYDKMIEEKRKELDAIAKEKERFFNLSSLRHMVIYINISLMRMKSNYGTNIKNI